MPHPPGEDREILLLKLKTVEPFIKHLEEKLSRIEWDLEKATALHPFDPAEQVLFLSRAEIEPGEFTPSHSLIVTDLEEAARCLGGEFAEKKKQADKLFRDRQLAVRVLNRQGAGPEAVGPFAVEFFRAAASLIRVGLQPALHLRGQLLDQLKRPEPIDLPAEKSRQGDPGEVNETANLFRRQGGDWTVRFRNGRMFPLNLNNGSAYVHYLLERPGRAVPAEEVAAYWDSLHRSGRMTTAADGVEVNRSRDDGAALDKTTRQQCRDEWERINAELDEAEKNNDIGRIAKLKEERQQLAGSVTRATRPGGRPVLVGDQKEKITDRVRKAIRRTIQDVGKKDAALGRHLHKAIRAGVMCIYAPESQPHWEL